MPFCYARMSHAIESLPRVIETVSQICIFFLEDRFSVNRVHSNGFVCSKEIRKLKTRKKKNRETTIARWRNGHPVYRVSRVVGGSILDTSI